MIEIGASEAPMILGVSPYATPWQVWARKLGLIPAQTATEEMAWGTALEQVVLMEFVKRAGLADRLYTLSPKTRRYHPERPWQRSTPDAAILEYPLTPAGAYDTLVEVKCFVNQSPPVPRVDHVVQCLHQRMVYPEVSQQFLVYFGGLALSWFEIPWHQRAADAILRAEERFLDRVAKEEPPPVRAADAAWLGKAWPWSKPTVLELTGDEIVAADEVYTASRSWAKLHEERIAASEATIKAAMGDAEQAVLPNGAVYTWKSHQRRKDDPNSGSVRPFKRVRGPQEDTTA